MTKIRPSILSIQMNIIKTQFSGGFIAIQLILIACVALLFETAMGAEKPLYEVLATRPHDSSYFTQGLELSGGALFESSGRYGESRVRKYHVDSDATFKEVQLPSQYFAEGLTLLAGELFLLTWKENTAFVLNPDNLAVERELSYPQQGWGLANNGKQLIMSDGSSTVYFRNPESFEVEREIRVYHQQHPVQRINELEFAEGYIWANIWQSTLIVKINPQTGELAGSYDLTELAADHIAGGREHVLNGIAYDAGRKAFWITGKLWSSRYLVRFN